MSTLRHKQLAPTADVLESIHGWINDARHQTDSVDIPSETARVLHNILDSLEMLTGTLAETIEDLRRRGLWEMR